MLGKPVPDSLTSTGGVTFESTKEPGKKLALYFYPTPAAPPTARISATTSIARDSLKSHDPGGIELC